MKGKKCINHLCDVDMSYFEHMKFALSVSTCLLSASVLCTVHAFIPFILTDAASKRVDYIHSTLKSR